MHEVPQLLKAMEREREWKGYFHGVVDCIALIARFLFGLCVGPVYGILAYCIKNKKHVGQVLKL